MCVATQFHENKVIFTISPSYFNNDGNVLMAQWLNHYRNEGFQLVVAR